MILEHGSLRLQEGNYIFTTEGHPIPVDHPLLRQPAQARMPGPVQSEAGDRPPLPGDRSGAAPGPCSAMCTQGGSAADCAEGAASEELGADAAAWQPSASSGATSGQWAQEQSWAGAMGFGTLRSNRSALEARLCPDFSRVRSISGLVARHAHLVCLLRREPPAIAHWHTLQGVEQRASGNTQIA